MKRILSYITTCALAATLFAGCAEDIKTDGVNDGMGCLTFKVKFDGKEATRADAPADCVVKIANSEGYLYIFESLAEVPEKLWLLSGSDYSITVEGGVKTEYGWDTPYYKGTESFSISDGQNTPVTVECLIQNTLFAVGFDETVTTGLTDYSVTLYPVPGDASKTLVFNSANPGAVGYVILADGQTTVDWTFSGTHTARGEVTKSGTLTGLQPRKKYELTFKYTVIEQNGEFQLTFSVDETTVDYAHNIVIHQRPRITPMEFDITEVQTPDADREIVATASSEIASLLVSGSVFGAGSELVGAAAPAGVTTDVIAANKISVMFTTALFTTMPAGQNEVTIKVTDANGLINTAVLKVTIEGSAPVSGTTNTVGRSAVWGTHAYVSGQVEGEPQEVKFGYRTNGGEWQYVAATDGAAGAYSAKITGLTSGASYETCIWVDGEQQGNPVAFTTETAVQLPNGGFEDWNQNSDVWYPNAATSEKFWDSGNKGSVKAPLIGNKNNNVTTGVNDPRTGSTGSKSVQLKSNWFGFMGAGAFAAASIYSGNFLEARANLSNPSGRVEFGRPWSGARPSAMKVWYKATLGTVNYAKSGAPISKGQQDKARIYIALADKGFPCEIDTADWDNFIDYETDVRIVAFGELVVESNVANWTEYTINLKYRSLDRVPTHIVVVASASMYGDYFAGSTSSIMYIDDFELIYNDNITLQE